ncbi:MAG: hypothetical protein A3B37_00175 [Candidatus Sungbacteria bacterium RIFCSPLOWO2_01_FULL_59_16]|uniref:Uncharacterized protein n=1 Tax=Candidatus Sungbacteria bacterium RIFCSPLOWO2_01_FULL_59_16 TaxID=1802280 RepID=A0A1G2LA60_9BACT|nr:MAG: hypothetical protein A3B37_00175 [Candidatus Sungbacteria bacterium RIFCSPLOWO2_01_FULL_59_16]
MKPALIGISVLALLYWMGAGNFISEIQEYRLKETFTADAGLERACEDAIRHKAYCLEKSFESSIISCRAPRAEACLPAGRPVEEWPKNAE